MKTAMSINMTPPPEPTTNYNDLYFIFRRFSILFIYLIGVHEVLPEIIYLRLYLSEY